MNKLITPLLLISLILASLSLGGLYYYHQSSQQQILEMQQKMIVIIQENEQLKQRIQNLEDSSIPNMGKKAADSLFEKIGAAVDALEKKVDESFGEPKASSPADQDKTPSKTIDAVWIDVRSIEEHQEDHIAGDLHIDHREIGDSISRFVSNKRTPINLYCRSGGRAGKAMATLKEMGYQNVFNVGGIEDARRLKREAQE